MEQPGLTSDHFTALVEAAIASEYDSLGFSRARALMETARSMKTFAVARYVSVDSRCGCVVGEHLFRTGVAQRGMSSNSQVIRMLDDTDPDLMMIGSVIDEYASDAMDLYDATSDDNIVLYIA